MSTQLEGVPPILARAAADLTEHGHSLPEALGLSVNTLRTVAAGKQGNPNYKQRNNAREIISTWQSSKTKLSAGLRKGIEKVEGSKRPLKPDEAHELVERAEHRLALHEGVLLAFEKASPKEPILDRVLEAATKLVGEGEIADVRTRLKEAVEGDRAVVEMFGLLEARQPIPAPAGQTRGEKLARTGDGSGKFKEELHPRDKGKFASKGGQTRARSGAASRSAANAGHEVSQSEIDNLLGELGFDSGDLAAYQKSVGLKASGKIDSVTYNMLKRQAALRNAAPKKGETVLSADQPSKESGPTNSPPPTKAKAKKAGKPARVVQAAVEEATSTTAWGGATTPLLVTGAMGMGVVAADGMGSDPYAYEIDPEVTRIWGLRSQVDLLVEARKAAQAEGDTITFTRVRAREEALREQLTHVEAEYMDHLQEVKSSAYPGLDRSPKENWVDKAGGLPSYIERIAKHLHYEKGMTISHAIATAVNTVKKWCAGKDNTKADTKAKACAAVAQWESKKASTKVTEAMDELREAARAEGAWYYPSEAECAEIIEGAEAMKDTYPPIRESIRGRLGDLVKWDPKKHPRNRVGEFTDVLSKLSGPQRANLRGKSDSPLMDMARGGDVGAHAELQYRHASWSKALERGYTEDARKLTPQGKTEFTERRAAIGQFLTPSTATDAFTFPQRSGAGAGKGGGVDYGGGAGVGHGHGPVRMRADEHRGMGAGKGEDVWDQIRDAKPMTVGAVLRNKYGMEPSSAATDVVTRALTKSASDPVDLKDTPLYDIAAQIRKEWKNVNFGAVPYLDAMGTMTSHKENYGLDSGDSILAYFLSNATGWRGDHAKRIKAELRRRLKESGVRGVEFAAKIERLEEATEQREAAAASGEREAFITARAREAGLREAVKAAL